MEERRELQDWLSSLPQRRLEEDAECRRLQESVSVLVGPSSRDTQNQIRRLMKSWGVKIYQGDQIVATAAGGAVGASCPQALSALEEQASVTKLEAIIRDEGSSISWR